MMQAIIGLLMFALVTLAMCGVGNWVDAPDAELETMEKLGRWHEME